MQTRGNPVNARGPQVWAVAVGAVVIVAGAAWFTLGPSDESQLVGASSEQQTVEPPGAPADLGARKPTSIVWESSCPDVPASWAAKGITQDSTQSCGWVRVPRDYAEPNGPKIKIRVSRIPASDPELRLGVLLTNPGVLGIDLPSQLKPLLPDDLRDHYDIIGFDLRGAGDSISRSTADTARDMDLIRVALGERRVSYYGVSNGKHLGSVYSSLFPQRTDRFILEGSVKLFEDDDHDALKEMDRDLDEFGQHLKDSFRNFENRFEDDDDRS
jgi:alpha/beta hydrolase family protein